MSAWFYIAALVVGVPYGIYMFWVWGWPVWLIPVGLVLAGLALYFLWPLLLLAWLAFGLHRERIYSTDRPDPRFMR